MAAAASTSWRGALEFAGFPIPVMLYNRVKSRSSESFKTIAPNGLPIHTRMFDTDGNEVEAITTRKGVPTGADTFVKLTDAQVESIRENRSTVVEPKQFCPLDSLPRELALTAYKVIPQDGAEKSASILWNGLRKTGWAYVTDIVMTGGGRDSILALYATDDGLWGVTLPYEVELKGVPDHMWLEDETQADVFQQFVQRFYQDALTNSFRHDLHESKWRQRRQAAIDAALSGTSVEATPRREVEEVVPDLMAKLQAELDAAAKRGLVPSE